jgi:ubiquinone/menaquinone biosynthesis C-methylase UbiE
MANSTKLDLGCGLFKKADFTGIDAFDYSDKYPNEFICGQVPEILSTFENESIDEIHAKHFIEHIPQNRVIYTFNEIYRILKPQCVFEIYVPHTGGRGAWCDPGHVSFWNDMSFRYYDMSWCKELSHSYGINCDFAILENKIIDEFNLHAILKKR